MSIEEQCREQIAIAKECACPCCCNTADVFKQVLDGIARIEAHVLVVEKRIECHGDRAYRMGLKRALRFLRGEEE